MADDKKKADDGMSLGAMVLYGIGFLFLLWLFTGGPARVENKYNPFLEPLVEPLGDGSIYGAGGKLQTKVEDMLVEGKYIGWSIQDRGDFAFLTPPNWTAGVSGNFNETEFGEITNGTITLNYQYGRNANQLDFENDINYLVEYGTVNGRWARFVKPSTSFGQTTGAFIKKNKRKRITIYTNEELTPEEQIQVFEIINTIRI